MAEIISKRERIEQTTYYREWWAYDEKGRRDHGFSFECDVDGTPLLKNADAKRHYDQAIEGGWPGYIDEGVVAYSHSYIEPAQLRCDCGHILWLSCFTNTCVECGRDYNMSGQILAPRSQWGYETGESVSEILRAGHTVS